MTTIMEIIPGVFEAAPVAAQSTTGCCCDCCPTG